MSTVDDVAATFRNHYAYWAEMPGGMVHRQLRSGEVAISRQYAGRVPFELLQNALDRCEDQVLIRAAGGRLVVGNDGTGLTIGPRFQHRQEVSEDNPLSDFHALCSIHTSNKTPARHYGNKGVGFRSVFSVADSVQVWSVLPGGGWWGLEMSREMTAAVWAARTKDAAVRRGLESFIGSLAAPPLHQPRPSFHFPLPLLSESPPIPDAEALGLATVVVVPLRSGGMAAIEEALGRLEEAHLDFVGLRRLANGQPQPQLTLQRGDATLRRRPMEGGVPVLPWSSQDPGLLRQAAAVGLSEMSSVGGAVRWPVRADTGRLYCYLPAASAARFHIDLHGDFQLGIDRKHLDVSGSSELACYNRAVVAGGARLHLAAVVRALGAEPEDIGWDDAPASPVRAGAGRGDLWRLLDPGPDYWHSKADDPLARAFVEPVRAILFPQGRPNLKRPEHWARWATLAAACFDGSACAAESLRDFWNTTQHWLETATRWYYKEAAQVAAACLQALADAGACVVPLTGHSGSSGDLPAQPIGTALPPSAQAGAGRRTDRRLFQILDRARWSGFSIPAPVRARGREVTGWGFPASFQDRERLRGASEFERAPLLQELRQLPSRRPSTGWSLEPLHPDPVVARQQQEALLAFAAELFVLQVARGTGEESYQDIAHPPGWRAQHGSKISDKQRAGRALATLFVPDCQGQWIPARQAHQARLDPGWLARLSAAVPGLDVSAFLQFLGVCTWAGGLLLVEEGAAGLVDPQPAPPQLTEASRGVELPALSVPLSGSGLLGAGPGAAAAGAAPVPGAALKQAIDAGWRAGWLPALAAAEREHPSRIAVLSSLGEAAWFPVEDADPPASLGEPPAALVPRQLTLRDRAPSRLLTVLWRVLPADEAERGWLAALGARSLDGRLERLSDVLALAVGLQEGLSLPELEGAARLGIVELQQRILERLAKEGSRWPAELPLLHYAPAAPGAVGLRGRSLRWGAPGSVWVADTPADWERIRQLFPSVPLLCATLGPRQRKDTPLQARGLSLDSTLQPQGAVAIPGGEEAARAAIAPLLPALLALAEVSRRFVHQVDPGEVRARWSRTRIRRYHDIWWEWSLRDGPAGLKPVTLQQGRFDDVAVRVHRKEKKRFDRAEVTYDVEPGRASALPPLANFAPALAEALLDRTAEPDLAAALGAFDAGGRAQLAALLRRRGGLELEDYFARQLSALSPEDVAAIQQAVAAALSVLGGGLAATWDPRKRARLGPSDLAPPLLDADEKTVNTALEEIPWTEAQQPFAPHFGCVEENRETWERWVRADSRRVRLLRAAWETRSSGECPRPRELLQHPLAGDLEQHIGLRQRQVRFAPAAAAEDWLDAHGALPAGGIAALPPLVRFTPVERSPICGGVAPVSLAPPSTVEGELSPATPAERGRDDARRASKGAGAEQAMLAWVTSETRRLLELHPTTGWAALLGAVPRRGRTRQQLTEARAGTRALADALHISVRWGSAGFDLLGLVEEDGEIVPARYEVKALPAEQGRVRVFLSRNELAVFRAVHTRADPRHASGVWRLIGVTPAGAARDLTPLLDPVRAAGSGPLHALAGSGMQPDSLELTLELSAQ